MEQTIRKVKINGRSEQQRLRVCTECGTKDWITYRSGVIQPTMCLKCSTNKLRLSNSTQINDVMPQDEEANRRMIDEFLAKRVS